MSGIAGIIQRDGAPADRQLLERMTGYLAFRGPDAQETWTQGEAGFGHTLLRTTWEAEKEKQPCTLDGRTWITADVRVDWREELVGELEAAGRSVSQEVTDPELILHAWHVWKEQCLEHLLGDFAFAIWDADERRLFCARDHFGVKLFYYSLAGGNFLFSNTLNCLRLSPAVSGELNDQAVVDFLIHECNQNPATTTFRDIQRLPPGHFLVCSKKEFRIREYWNLPVDEPIFYKRADDYVEHFQDLLGKAVRDRLRTDRAGVFMSGGLDSSGLAATAREILEKRAAPHDLRAYTLVYDWLIPDQERHYAGLAADGLGIPIDFLAADDYKLYERWEQLHTPEPAHCPTRLAQNYDQFTKISPHTRVMFYGEGPDNAMYYEWKPYVLYLVTKLRWGRLLRDLAWHARFHKRPPILGGLGNRLKRLRKHDPVQAPQPEWIHPEMLKLATREGSPRAVHPIQPIRYGWVTSTQWDSIFEYFDAGTTSFPVEVRHPYMDVRVMRYLLAIPPIPWCRNKYLLRRAFRNKLTKVVLQRPKTGMQGDVLSALINLSGLSPWVDDPCLERYVDSDMVRTVLSNAQVIHVKALKAISLNFWLAFRESSIRK
jgi:asparagine synthase (glutamine-hydrolysing)